jgi:hypothetical protein
MMIEMHTTHGMTETPEFRAWAAIKSRCYNENVTGYPDWGGRGITMCDEWRDSFETFIAYVGKRPSPKHSIDRYPNNDGNYEPGNVRWATRVEQCNNRRSSRFIEFKGQTFTLTQWADKLGFKEGTLTMRFKRGWTVEAAFTTPLY